MIFEEAKCPKCSGELRVPPNLGVVKCMYCGSDIIVQKAITEKSQPSIKSLLQTAATAMAAENYSEAYKYFTKILDMSPEFEIAWVGRGLSVGFMAKIEHQQYIQDSVSREIEPREKEEREKEEELKKEEALFCFKRALELNPMSDFANYAPIRLNDFDERLWGKTSMGEWKTGRLRTYRLPKNEFAEKEIREEDEIRKKYEESREDKSIWTYAETYIVVIAGRYEEKCNLKRSDECKIGMRAVLGC